MARFAIGVDLGGTNIKVGLVEEERGIVRQASARTDAKNGPDHVLDRIAATVERVWQALPDGERISGIGIGAPGAVSLDRTTITKPPNLPGWDQIHMPEALSARLDLGRCPVRVENDANVAGLGSAFYGAGIPFDSFIMVTLGTGVGGAIIHDKKLFRGTNGGAGELGHMSIDFEGPYARSGVPGAAEAYLGQHFLSRHARYQLLARNTHLHEITGPDLCDVTPKKLYMAALAGDQGAQDVLAWAGHKLGCVLGSAVNLLDIRKVVVGGGVSNVGEYLLGPARDTLKRHVMPALMEGVDLVQETLGNEVALLGAARLAFDRDPSTP